MTKFMKRYVLLLAAVVVFAVVIVATPHTFASGASDNICTGLTLTGATKAQCSDTTTLSGVVKKVVSILSVLVGVTAVIFVIVGGFKFITSSGDAQKAASARNTILYAVIGLAVAALAQFIVAYVLANVK
jgi:hypothetical protein